MIETGRSMMPEKESLRKTVKDNPVEFQQILRYHHGKLKLNGIEQAIFALW